MISLARNVTVIPAKKTIGTQIATDKKQKARVAAYCRVITDSDEQETSYEMQIEHYTSYREYLSGHSFLKIKRSLEADGVLNGAGHAKWNESNIKQILTNEKYIGDALLQKTYTMDILEKKRESNKGQIPKYYVENSHESIVPKDIFFKVHVEITRRANLTNGKHSTNESTATCMHYQAWSSAHIAEIYSQNQME